MKRNRSVEPAHDLGSLAEDAKALLSATADVAEDKVVAARERLSAALERGHETWNTVQDRVAKSAKAADKTIRRHPYQALGIAFGAGALIGLWLKRRD